MNIREAALRDIPALRVLYRALYDESAKLAPALYRAADQSEEFLANNIETEYALVLVAEQDGEVCGFALAQQQFTPPFACFVEHRYAHLMDLVVQSDRRGQGIGTRLIAGVRDWARGRGLDYLELNVIADNYGARRLYEQAGFAPSMLNFKQML